MMTVVAAAVIVMSVLSEAGPALWLLTIGLFCKVMVVSSNNNQKIV